MEIHYFQRYHSQENVSTANTMLLFSRLYSHSSSKFYNLIENILEEEYEPLNFELSMKLQEKSKDSVPDAVIFQPNFKIVIETKLYNNFGTKQLEHHLFSFQNNGEKILLTLDPQELKEEKKEEIKNMIKTKNPNVKHIHLTFEKLIGFIKNIIDSNDDFSNIVEDYENYCYEGGLISDMDKKLDVRLCGTTYETNKALNLYYCPASWGYQKCKYLGLYKQKAVRNIGEIIATAEVTAKNNDIDKLEFSAIDGTLSKDMKENAKKAFQEASQYDYDLTRCPHRFFFVDQFYETSYRKTTPRAPQGKRIFNLQKILEFENKTKLPSTAEIAELLKTKEW